MTPLTIAAGLILPWLAGTLAWIALAGWPTRGLQWVIAVSYGFIGGCLLAASASGLAMHLGLGTDVGVPALLMLSAVAALAGLIAFRQPREILRIEPGGGGVSWLIGLLGLLLALRVAGVSFELLLRPVFPWDAWAAWMLKSKTWYLLGEFVPFVIEHQWLEQDTVTAWPSLIAHYPNTSAYLQVYLASVAGQWHEPFVNLPALGAYLALVTAGYAQLRVLGVRPVVAALTAYSIGSLPLLGVHVALAGYVDIFLACQFSLAFLCLARASLLGHSRQFAAAMVLVILLPVWKLEGAIWLACVLPMALYGFVPQRWRGRVLIVFSLVALGALLFQRFALPLPGLGWIVWDGRYVAISGIGVATLSWQGVAPGLTEALFVAPNWNLMAYALGPALVWAAWESRRERALRELGSVLVFAFAYLLVVFLYTEAARWMADLTGVNRVLMQVLPTIALFCAIVWARRERSRRLAWSDRPG